MWWSLVASSALVSGASLRELGSNLEITFKDGVKWTIHIVEISSIHKSLTFEVSKTMLRVFFND